MILTGQERARHEGAPTRPGGRGRAPQHPAAGRRRGGATGSRATGCPERNAEGRRCRACCSTAPPAGRQLVYRRRASRCSKKTGGHYPAPLAALEAVRVGLEQGIKAGLAEEHRAFGELAVSDVSRKLVQIFFATTALKKDDGVRPAPAMPRGRSAGWASSARASWAPASRAPPCSTRGRHPAQGRRPGPGREGPQGRDGMLDERLKRRRLTRPAVRAAERAALRRDRLSAGSAGPTW